MSVYYPIRPTDFRVTPFDAYKEYTVTSASYSASAYKVYKAIPRGKPAPIGSLINDDVENFDGVYRSVVWSNIDHMYYLWPYDASRTFEHINQTKTHKQLFYSASVLGIPYFELGRQIKPGSFSLSAENPIDPNNNDILELRDDGLGQLKDDSIDSSSFANESRLVGYLTFNQQFRKFRNNFGTIISGSIHDGYREYHLRNIVIDKGIDLTGSSGITTVPPTPSGLSGNFLTGSESYIISETDPLIEFDGCNPYTLSFWIKAPISQSDIAYPTSMIIDKCTLFTREEYDPVAGVPVLREKEFTSATRRPFRFEFANHTDISSRQGEVIFSVSDGNSIVSMSCGNVTGSSHHHIAVTYNSLTKEYRSFLNGINVDSRTVSFIREPENDAKLIIGAANRRGKQQFSGSIAEFRIYNYSASLSQIESLSNRHYISASCYQSAVAGNVFYRQGKVVVSSPLPKHHDVMFSNVKTAWFAEYQGVHRIYEHEILVRAPRGILNMTMNRTATELRDVSGNRTCDKPTRRFPGGEFYLPDFSGSLRPYITTIGLYNDKAQLLAVAKLAQPIQKRDDVDMNFIIRYDL